MAVLMSVPVAVSGKLTAMVTLRLSPSIKVPRAQVTAPLSWLHPTDADWKVTLTGKVSVSWTVVASKGPLLRTFSV